LRDWHEKYEPAGLTIIGVHSPEFFWERSFARVKEATATLGIKYPVVQDNGFEIWNRYSVRAWPTIVLIDKRGIIRYSYIGEGAYQRTESVIRQLLVEEN
jgi:alkyl hydroperoxide reductase subunit AhpC